MELLKRIDFARGKIGMTRAQLARELGLSPQAISSLGRRKNARLKHANIEKAAEILQCNFMWLSTGQGAYRQELVAGGKPVGAIHSLSGSLMAPVVDAEEAAAVHVPRPR